MARFGWRGFEDAGREAPQGLCTVAAEGFIPSRHRRNGSPVLRRFGITDRFAFYICFFVFCLPVLARAVAPDSLSVLRGAVVQSPQDGDAWVRLGYAYVAADSLDRAEEAFKDGERYVHSAVLYNGLGRVYMAQEPKKMRQAFPLFRKALRIDPGYIEAQLNIARTHALLHDVDTESAYRKVIKMDSTYAPAYLELAHWYLDQGYGVYYDEIRPLYTRYLDLRPNDMGGYYGLALSYTDQHRYQAVLDMALVAIRKKGIDAPLTALMAQAYAARGEPDKAMALFEKYLAMISPKERALYEDIRLVGFPEEVKAYAATPENEREAFLERFWRKHDPLIVSGGKARRAEHYRRVWYARMHFVKKAYPWDRRGEIYIRYGEPDYRSRSGFPNALPSVAVESVKTMLQAEMSGPGAFINLQPSSPDAFFAGQGEDPDPAVRGGIGSPLIDAVYPVLADPGMTIKEVPWESWIYTDIGGGVEFAFRDEYMNGAFVFLPMSEIVLQRVSGETPEQFGVPPGIEPLEFYYDVAQFRGDAGKTAVEVYFGVPPEQVAIQDAQGRVVRTLAIADRDGDRVYRDQSVLRFSAGDSAAARAGAFVPDVAALKVPPGTYELAVQVTDQQSGKWGVYKQALTVPAFGDSLAMSDLEMAWRINDISAGEKFHKGDVWVVPMPSRNYLRRQSVYVYYEVYNLARDDYGQTHYRVDYTIQQDVRKGVGMFGALSAGVQKLLASGKPQVAVGYERAGRTAWEPIYLELDMAKVKFGLNQLSVTVTDLVSDQVVSKRAMFQLSE